MIIFNYSAMREIAEKAKAFRLAKRMPLKQLASKAGYPGAYSHKSREVVQILPSCKGT